MAKTSRLKRIRRRPAQVRWKKQPRRPFGPLYAMACLLARGYFRLARGLVIDRSALEGIQASVLVLCNHESNLDFLVAATTLYPLRVNFMVTTWFFNSRALAGLLRLMGCIPKKQFVPDSAAVKSAMKVIARGDSVALFPEGQVSFCGGNSPVDESLGKLVKKLGVTTVALSIRGNHLTCPKWSWEGKSYRGRVECTAHKVFTPEMLETLPLAEITRRAVDSVRYSEYEWQRRAQVSYQPPVRQTNGLQNYLHRCPLCGADFAMRSEGDTLRCERCGYGVRFDARGFFEALDGASLPFDNPEDWYADIRARYRDSMVQGNALPLSSPCTLLRTLPHRHGYHPCGEGVMTLDGSGLHFRGLLDGGDFSVSALYEHQSCLPHSANPGCVDIQSDVGYFGLQPRESRRLTQFVELYETACRQWRAARRA